MARNAFTGDEYIRRFGKHLLFVRTCINLKQDAFAEMLGLNHSKYQNIESGHVVNEYAVFIWIVDRIRVYFGLDVFTLIGSDFDEEKVCETVRSSWNYYQKHPEMEKLLIPDDKYKVITPEQLQHLINEKRLKKRKDAKGKKRKEEKRLFINVRMGDRVKHICQSMHKNQDELADSLCVSEDRIATLEEGDSMRDFSIFIRLLLLLQRLDITFEDLVGERYDRDEIKKRVQEARVRNRSAFVIASSVIIKTKGSSE